MGMLSDDRTCDECWGEGSNRDYQGRLTKQLSGRSDRCSACFGTGRRLTELGREMFRLLEEHFDLMPKPR